MSKEYDKRAKIRLTKENLKAIEGIHKRFAIAVSRDAVANAVISHGLTTYTIPQIGSTR